MCILIRLRCSLLQSRPRVSKNRCSAGSHPKHTPPARRKPWKTSCAARASRHRHSWQLSEPTKHSGISTPKTLTQPFSSIYLTNIFICRFCCGHFSGNAVNDATQRTFLYMYLGTISTFLVRISTFEYVTESVFCGLRFFYIPLQRISEVGADTPPRKRTKKHPNY